MGETMDMPTGPFLDPVRQDIHIVKCVVVGDSGVGKTRLICARACNTKHTLQQLMQTHIPTVWAIDQYRKSKEVLEKSWFTIDNVSVSLRLWDTFGYHDKDRRFAYGRADVILLCFSVVRPRTLHSVVQHWYPEIKHFCPGVPIILCACQIDLRYIYLDENFKKMDKGPFFREILDEDIVTPEQGRAVAKEIGAAYYETSVYVPWGIDDLFMNVMRAALTSKRDRNFWNILGNLKRISKPLCQAPLEPPQTPAPKVVIPPATLQQDMQTLLNNQTFCDVTFLVQGVCIPAHKTCLMVACNVFEELFMSDLASPTDGNTNKLPPKLQHTSNRSSGCVSRREIADRVCLLSDDENDNTFTPTKPDSNGCFPRHVMNHPAFTSIQLQHCDDVFAPGHQVLQTVITVADSIAPASFQYVLTYLYTGHMSANYDILPEVRYAADLIGVKDLVYIVTNTLNNESYLNGEVEKCFHAQRIQKLRDLSIRRSIFADITFEVDDGSVLAHKALLMAGCDVMLGMFSYNFKESIAKVISFPGVSCSTFRALQEYLYTGLCPSLRGVDCMELIELANRLCVPRLITMSENFLVEEFTLADDTGKDIVEDVLMLLEPAQLHNANQLANWCLWFLSCHYDTLYHKYLKALQMLKPDNQIHLSKHRWPPTWYVKELEYYERCLLDMEREQSLRPYARRGSDDCSDSGCLGFCGRSKRRSLHHTLD